MINAKMKHVAMTRDYTKELRNLCFNMRDIRVIFTQKNSTLPHIYKEM